MCVHSTRLFADNKPHKHIIGCNSAPYVSQFIKLLAIMYVKALGTTCGTPAGLASRWPQLNLAAKGRKDPKNATHRRVRLLAKAASGLHPDKKKQLTLAAPFYTTKVIGEFTGAHQAHTSLALPAAGVLSDTLCNDAGEWTCCKVDSFSSVGAGVSHTWPL